MPAPTVALTAERAAELRAELTQLITPRLLAHYAQGLEGTWAYLRAVRSLPADFPTLAVVNASEAVWEQLKQEHSQEHEHIAPLARIYAALRELTLDPEGFAAAQERPGE